MPVDAKRVQSIFLAAIEISDRAERVAAVERLCGDDAEIRRRVQALLQAHDEPESLPRAAEKRVDETINPPALHRPGTVIAGRYKLLEQIGEGGMGAVWVAEQTEPVRRRVAMKLIKPGMDTKQVLSRFAAERQALALMDHPNIAKVYDGGMTEEGRPFFVMEYVKGVPITDYCDQAKLGIEERLKLFVPISQAVQHAHQKGIIHRDLKPSNLLVCLYDGKPVPKVIDFGLAKAVSQPLTEHTLYTAHGLMVGTPMYMSPEQAEFNNLDVDTRTDIYSLGVILYELLTGTTPLEKQKFKNAAFAEILRLIKEEEPPKPSTKLSGSATLPAIAAQRGLEPAQLSRVVRGELDWIVMKALEKERSRRYETASGLTRDVERYLHDEPVEACPPSLSYKFRKFARRNMRALATALLFGIVVVGALVAVAGSIGWAVRDRETRQAVVERKILLALDKAEAAYKQDKLAEAQAAVHQAEGLLASSDPRPEVAQRFRQWLADLAMVDQLEKIHLEKAAAVKDEHFDPASAAIPYGKAFQEYGLDLSKIGPLDAAQKLQSAPIKKHLLAALDDWAFLSNDSQRTRLLNIARQADADAWRNRLRIALESRDASGLKELAADDACLSQSSITLTMLASQLVKLGERRAAVALLRRAQGPYPNDFWINEHLGNLLLLDSKADEAAIYLRMASGKFPNSAVARNNLGVALAFSNKLPEAAEEYRASIRAKADFAMPHYNLAELLVQQGKLPEAESSARDAVRLRPTSGAMHAGLADCLIAQSKFTEAEKSYLDALSNAPDDWQINEGYVHWLNRANRLAAVQQEYRQKLKANPSEARLHRLLGDLLRRNDDLAAAETEYREAIRLNAKDALAQTKLGSVLLEQEKLSEAESALREAVRLGPELSSAQMYLGAALNKQSKWADAESFLRKSLELDPNEYLAYMLLTTNLRNQNKSTVDLPRPTTLGSPVGSVAGPRPRARFKAQFELGTTYRTYSGFTEREMALLRGPGGIFSSGPTGSTSTRSSGAEEAQLRAAIRQNPKDSESRERLGLLLINQGNRSAAQTIMWEGICLEPTKYRLHAYLGAAMHGSPSYAEAAFKESIRLYPDYPYAHRALAWALVRQGKHAEALAAIREAARLEPIGADNHHALGWILAKHDDLAAAEAAYREEVRLQPQRAAAHDELGLVLHRAGKKDEAAAEFAQSKQLQPSLFAAPADAGNYYASASLLWHAAHYYQAATAQNPDDIAATTRAALLLLFQGDRSGYEKLCREILDRFGQTTNEVDVHRIVQTCLITPEIVGDLAMHTRLAERLVGTGDLSVISPRDRGLVAYRNGNWEETLRWCRESRAVNTRVTSSPLSASTLATGNEALYSAQNFVVEAMALHQLGKAAEARKAYELAARQGSGYYPFAPHFLGSNWKEWLTYELNRREAAQLLSIQDNSDWPRPLGRGRALAGAGDWQAGAAEIARACQSPAATSLEFIAAGTALARAEDREGYRKHCQAMIERFGGTGEWNEIERTVKVCALAPFDVEIPGEMLAAVSKGLDDGTVTGYLAAWGNTARSHAAYRQGRYGDAAKWADIAAQQTTVIYPSIQGYLISAAAHQRLGDSAAAKSRLATALDLGNRQTWPKLADGALDERLLVTESGGWFDVLAIDLMRREAVALLEGKKTDVTSAAADAKSK